VLDAFQTEQRVGEFADVARLASQRDHFHTIVVTDVDVQRRNDQTVRSCCISPIRSASSRA
jgi:hypothetical protein